MKRALVHYWDILKRTFDDSPYFLIFATCVLAFQNAWVPGMFLDGGIYATLGKNAAQLGHWFIPHFTPEGFNKFFEHPPFVFMIEGVLMKLFGPSWTVARMTGFIFTSLLLWITYNKTTGQLGKRTAYLAIIILLLTLPFLKKQRFLNLDVPLTFSFATCLFLYFQAYLTDKMKYWSLSGIFFGLALMSKGLPALFIPFIIFLHLIFSQKIKLLGRPGPWIALIIGFIIFSIWPIGLLIQGEYSGFQFWFNKQFFATVVQGRNHESQHFFTYFVFLIKHCLPWFLLSLWGQKIFLKEESNDHIGRLLIAWFWGFLIPISFVGWKLSHYIMPVYPAMAVMAAYALSKISETAQNIFANTFKYVVIIFALVLIIFPVGTKVRRDKFLNQAVQVTRLLPNQPNAWADVESFYGFWSFAAHMGMATDAKIYDLKLKDIEGYIESNLLKDNSYRWAFYISESHWNELKIKFPKLIETKLQVLLRNQKRGGLVVVSKSTLSNETDSLLTW